MSAKCKRCLQEKELLSKCILCALSSTDARIRALLLLPSQGTAWVGHTLHPTPDTEGLSP